MEEKKLKEESLYVFKDGQLKRIDKPKNGFGKTTIHWQDNKAVRVETNYTQTIE
ncbi:DUF3954 domain-containing protein [Desemzia incerta]|uniref:DUF3954 domain-containing protein n=1 Tax=Desemzia incerta TaxID=82801 RepID=UPI003D074FB3